MANGGQPSADQPRAQRTNRTDWDALVMELYTNVISGVPFGIGIASKQKGLLGASLKLQLNQNFPIPPVTAYISKNFNVAKLDRIFQSAQGLEWDSRHGLYKVAGDVKNMGLPRNTLVYPFENPSYKNMRAVLIFGGERLEGRLESQLQGAAEILRVVPRSSPRGGLTLERERLVEALNKIDPKRMFVYDLDLLARIVNGLEETKEDLPKHLKPIFKYVSYYFLKWELKRR